MDRRIRRSLIRGQPAVLATAIVFLLLVSTCAGASNVVTLKAPFKGSTATLYSGVSAVGSPNCSAANITHAPSWSRFIGVLMWESHAKVVSSTSCLSPHPFDTEAGALFDAQVRVPIHAPPANGTYSVVATWTLRISANWSVVHSQCPRVIRVNGTGSQSCVVEAGIGVHLNQAFLTDLTSGSVVFSPSNNSPRISNGSIWAHSVQCISGKCSITRTSIGHGTGQWTSTIILRVHWHSIRLNMTDRYALNFSFTIDMGTSVSAYPQPWNAAAQMTLDLATAKSGLFLSSVDIR